MYCDATRLAKIREQIKGKELKEIYPDWANGIIYFRFATMGGDKTTILSVKNNYYAGLYILKNAGEIIGGAE